MLEKLRQELSENPNRIYYDMPAEIYHHRDCPGVSASKLSLLHKSFANYRYKTEHHEHTAAMDFGSALHDSVLLPEVFENTYVKAIDCDRRTKIGKEKYDEFCKTAADKVVIPKDDYSKIIAMRDKILNNTPCAKLLKDAFTEVSMFWIDDETGIQCKGRMDIYRDGVILDIKTTKDASRKAFSRSIGDYEYDRAAAFYLDGISKITGKKHEAFAYIAIEKEPPFELGLYVLGVKSIEVGRLLYKRDLQKYIAYTKLRETDQIEAVEFESIDLPAWSQNIENR